MDVYGLQILDATLEAGNTVEAEEDTAASALLLKHEPLDGGADDVTLATLGEVLLELTLTTLGNFLVRSNSQSSVALVSFTVGGFVLEGYAMTLSAFAWNIVRLHADAGETLLLRLPVPAGHGLQLGDVRQRGRQRGAAPQRELRNRRALEALLGAGQDLVEQLAAASERVFAKLTPEAVRQRLLPSVRQSRGGDWMLKAKLPAHARFWNAGGTFADRPAELAHCAARVRLRARSLWLMSGMRGLSLEVTDLRVEPPCRECPL